MEGANMAEIFKMAQKVAANISQNQTQEFNPETDMAKIMSQVTESVSTMVTPEFLSQMGGNPGNPVNPVNKGNPVKSKINFNESTLEEIDSDSENKSTVLKTKDLHFTLNVTLDDLYNGKQKKIGVRRKKIVQNGKRKSI